MLPFCILTSFGFIVLQQVNNVNRTGTTDGEGVSPERPGVSDLAPVSYHPATDQILKKKKWEKEVNKVVIEC